MNETNERQTRSKVAKSSRASEDKRKDYQPPELKDLGSVAEVTGSMGSSGGADAAYS